MTTAGITGFHYKLRNLIKKGLRGTFTDDKVIMVIPPDERTKLSPEAHEAKIAVCITALPIRNGSAHEDGEHLKQLQEHLMLALEDSGLVQHSDSEKYAGVEATTRKGVLTIIMYASDPETLEHILNDGIKRMYDKRVETAFHNYRKFQL